MKKVHPPPNAEALSAVRRIALGYADEAEAALRRLKKKSDPEALHDFRVATRRLTSTLKLYRPLWKKRIPKKVIRHLRDLAADTNSSRDLETQLAWLERSDSRLPPEEREARHWLAQDLRRAGDGGVDPKSLRKRLRRERKKLEVELRPKRRADAEPRFGAAAAQALRRASSNLFDRLEQLRRPSQSREAHKVRIAAKHLRYLLEPLTELSEAERMVKAMKELQGLLGELHDEHVLEAVVVSRAKALNGDGGALRSGLRELQHKLRAEERARFAKARAGFLDSRQISLSKRVQSAVRALERG